MSKKDILVINKKFGELTVIKQTNLEENVSKNARNWECQCDCGNIITCREFLLTNGLIKSCCKNIKIKQKHIDNFELISNQKFGKLKVLSIVGVKNSRLFVLCICDCGNKIITSIRHLKDKSIKSCGCLLKERNAKIRAIIEDRIGFPWIQELEAYKKANADTRNLSFSLSLDEFKKLVMDNCYYCGLEPLIQVRVKNSLKRNSIDRMDNNIGYEFYNCITSCKICNRAKNNMKYDDFIAWIQRLKQSSLC